MNDILKSDLQSLRGDLILYKASINEVAADIVREGISTHPIFIAHRVELPFGECILDHSELATNWSISASTLEEMLENRIIEPDKESLFRSSYKDPSKYICMLLVSEGGSSFIYVPYEVKDRETLDEQEW